MKTYLFKKLSLFVAVTATMLCLLSFAAFAVATPAKAESLKAKATATSVTLTWGKVKNCDAYAVFSYSPAKEKYTFIKNVKDTEYKITDLSEGETYYYAIQSYNNDGDEKVYGDISDYVKVTTKVEEPDKVKGLSDAAVYSTKLKLTWDKMPGMKYAVYFYNASTKKYTHIDNTSSTSLTVKDLDPEKTYTFAVRAYKKAGGKTYYGEYSAKLKVTTNPMPLELEDARKIYEKAVDVYMNWIYSCSYTASSGYINREFYGLLCKFAPVDHPDIKTKKDLENMLSNYFVKEIYENELYLYIEVGGKLYYYAEGGSGNPDKGTKHYTDAVKKITYKKYKYTLYPTYYATFDDKYAPESYTFTIIRKDGRWIFDGNFYPCSAKIKE